MTRNVYGLTLDWRDRLRAGDIIISSTGTPRVVRKASYKSNGFLWGVALVILKCSWTGRCYTWVTRCDLARRGFVPSGKSIHFKAGTIDAAIWREIRDSPWPKDIRVTCCTVKGLT